MPELKPLPKEAVPEAHEKAKHYRYLGASWQAESICRDILETDPDNQEVINTLVLAITDQFESFARTSPAYALEMANKLTDPYKAEYCKGLIYERRAIATYKRNLEGGGSMAYTHFERAMQHYENAEKHEPGDKKVSILRWNACARFINQFKLSPPTEETGVEPFLDV